MELFNTSGRLRRTEYIFQKINSTLMFIAVILIAVIGRNNSDNIFFEVSSTILMLLGFIGYFTLDIVSTVKRFHDLNKTGSNYFLLLIPLYNVILLIGLLFEKGTHGTNNYGSEPRLDESNNHKLKIRNGLVLFGVLIFGLWQLFAVYDNSSSKNITKAVNNPEVSDYMIYLADEENEYKFGVVKVSQVTEDSVRLYIGNYLFKSTNDAQ